MLLSNTVHLWRIDLSDLDDGDVRLEQMLSPGERLRAKAYHFARDRARFVVVRGALRRLLGGYLNHPPARLTLCQGTYGKPTVVETGPAGARLDFNVSHTDGLALLAFAWERVIGVDVERIRPMPEFDQISKRFFAPTECVALAGLPAHEQLRGFFTCWTRKEAYLKAHGAGLALPLDSFVVSVAPHEPARVLSVRDDPDAPTRWHLESLALAPGYVGALAVAGDSWSLETKGDVADWLA